jgi:hypothetical protein
VVSPILRNRPERLPAETRSAVPEYKNGRGFADRGRTNLANGGSIARAAVRVTAFQTFLLMSRHSLFWQQDISANERLR